jgi:hypothetical protein
MARPISVTALQNAKTMLTNGEVQGYYNYLFGQGYGYDLSRYSFRLGDLSPHAAVSSTHPLAHRDAS